MPPSLGELRFAQSLFSTERCARPRLVPLSPIGRRLYGGAVVLTFVFFLFM